MRWASASTMRPSHSPIAGDHSGTMRCSRARAVMTSCASSSLSARRTPDPMAAASEPTRAAWSGSLSQAPRRAAMEVDSSFVRTTSAARKFVSTNSPSDWPISSLRRGMIAVWGMGIPNGCRNSAVTANQSARAPTMPPSAAARRYASAGTCCWPMNPTRNRAAMSSSAPRATDFIVRRPRRRSWSAGLSEAVGV